MKMVCTEEQEHGHTLIGRHYMHSGAFTSQHADVLDEQQVHKDNATTTSPHTMYLLLALPSHQSTSGHGHHSSCVAVNPRLRVEMRIRAGIQ